MMTFPSHKLVANSKEVRKPYYLLLPRNESEKKRFKPSPFMFGLVRQRVKENKMSLNSKQFIPFEITLVGSVKESIPYLRGFSESEPNCTTYYDVGVQYFSRYTTGIFRHPMEACANGKQTV